jgi:hypothetical protein
VCLVGRAAGWRAGAVARWRRPGPIAVQDLRRGCPR